MKLWEIKKSSLNKKIEEYTVGEDSVIDNVIVPYDCMVTLAHAKLLYKMGILSKSELKKLVVELKGIMKLSKRGLFKIEKEEEDSHTAIENYLTARLGSIGKKIHAFRSRNEQIIGAFRLFCKEELANIEKLINDLIDEIKNFKIKYGKIKLPGYTHTRKAMESNLGMWCDWIIESMEDNKKLIATVKELIDQCPLGTGAGFGLPVKVDRNFLAKKSGFKTVQKSPVYTQNSRGKFESTILHVLTQIMFDLNKISSDIILFSLDNFGYFSLPNDICTGSSMMPHKRNPDALEIMRGNYHKVLSYEFQIKSLISNLISGYHRDFQLTKKPVVEAFKITKTSLEIMTLIIRSVGVNKTKCEQDLTSDLYSVNKVYKKVMEGKPFREAYRKVKKIMKKV